MLQPQLLRKLRQDYVLNPTMNSLARSCLKKHWMWCESRGQRLKLDMIVHASNPKRSGSQIRKILNSYLAWAFQQLSPCLRFSKFLNFFVVVKVWNK